MYDPALVEENIKLLREGFTEDQIVSLLRLRDQAKRINAADMPAEYKRLKFARWRVENNLLEE